MLLLLLLLMLLLLLLLLPLSVFLFAPFVTDLKRYLCRRPALRVIAVTFCHRRPLPDTVFISPPADDRGAVRFGSAGTRREGAAREQGRPQEGECETADFSANRNISLSCRGKCQRCVVTHLWTLGYPPGGSFLCPDRWCLVSVSGSVVF